MHVLAHSYGWQPTAYLVLDDRGEPRAGLPFCRISDMLGERLVALPFSDYCDPLVNDAASWHLLMDHLLSEQCPVTLRCLHSRLPLDDTRLTLAKEAKWHRLDLHPGLDELWNGMHDSTRRAIRKSERSGLAVRMAQSEPELRAFFEMHLRVRKYKYGLLAQPYSFFQNIWRQFVDSQQGFLLLAFNGDSIVAGDFFLQWKETLYYKFNASIPDNLSCRPNDLLIWEGIQLGKQRGFTYLDFGLSDVDQEGLLRYKRKFGTEEGTISFLRHTPNGTPAPAEKALRELLGKLTTRFTDHLISDLVTEKAGDALYRLFT
jgi:CelD/BcsL family acetyltransferase involved in cellulose biosynthesis